MSIPHIKDVWIGTSDSKWKENIELWNKASKKWKENSNNSDKNVSGIAFRITDGGWYNVLSRYKTENVVGVNLKYRGGVKLNLMTGYIEFNFNKIDKHLTYVRGGISLFSSSGNIQKISNTHNISQNKVIESIDDNRYIVDSLTQKVSEDMTKIENNNKFSNKEINSINNVIKKITKEEKIINETTSEIKDNTEIYKQTISKINYKEEKIDKSVKKEKEKTEKIVNLTRNYKNKTEKIKKKIIKKNKEDKEFESLQMDIKSINHETNSFSLEAGFISFEEG